MTAAPYVDTVTGRLYAAAKLLDGPLAGYVREGRSVNVDTYGVDASTDVHIFGVEPFELADAFERDDKTAENIDADLIVRSVTLTIDGIDVILYRR